MAGYTCVFVCLCTQAHVHTSLFVTRKQKNSLFVSGYEIATRRRGWDRDYVMPYRLFLGYPYTENMGKLFTDF